MRGYAELCLADLQATGRIRAEVIVESGGGVTVLLIVFPTPDARLQPGLTPCERGGLQVLAQAKQGQVLSAPRIRDTLENQKLGIWGEVTVKRSLLVLKRLGLLCSSRKKPRGYWLADTIPLFSRRTG